MKKFRMFFMLLAVISALVLSGCGRAPSASEPRDVAEIFMQSIAEVDVEQAKEYATDQAAQLLDMMAPMMEPNPDADLEFVDETIDGDKAVVKLRDKSTGDIEEIDLRKVDGEWKVDVVKDE